MRRLVVFLIPFATACYKYAPIEVASVSAGTSVRARVTPAAAARIAPLVGSSDIRLVSGRLIESGAEGMIVEVPTIVPADIGSSIQTLHQRVSIARVDLIELESRRLDPLRTGALVGGMAIVVGGAAYRALRGEGGPGVIRPGGGTEIQVMLLRVFR